MRQRAREVEAARAAVDQARAAVRLAEVTRWQAVLRAPQSGVVLARLVEVGELVSPGAPILTIADLNRPYLRVFVPEADLGRVRLGQPVEVRVDAYPDRVFWGRVVEIANRAEYTPGNVQTREERTQLVFAVRIALENPDWILKPGLPADAIIRFRP
ncbi:MAG: efflux RND transporter periplasmic adaptor subunit [Armatimonadetes bacterium]|nr:efflux RND transporter periplasmic adaptor subunit [Armatimonadota bacterium]